MFPAILPRPLRLALYAAAVGVLFWLTLSPTDELPKVTLWDKAEHALAWFVLTALGLVLSPRRPRAIAVFALFLGVLVEVLQAILPVGRDADWHDAVADSVGVFAALGLYALGLRLARGRTDP
ncbi:VanZ family protein [Phenylobacterium aquaticum]|uniref:VanZ family protein n=1 Tax=Phenylobacterium aquaticum TaxID=1763816 RepID=UPI001F5C69FD|nr:VanZ family protein [Phenylobacterium aquaticum]MCI3134066.1 VanZ family protein [Phenylobacterium aquaticum]